MPSLDSLEASDMVEKMRDLDEDTRQLIELLVRDHECFTKSGEGRVKKTEIVNKLGWSSRRLEDVLARCRKFLGDQL